MNDDTKTEKEDTDSSVTGQDGELDKGQSGTGVSVISGSKGQIQWQLGTPMPESRGKSCAVAADSDTIYVVGKYLS